MYTRKLDGTLVRDSDGAYIPEDPRNVDYAAFLAWESDGGVPQVGRLLLKSPQARIAEIEAANPIPHRALRELLLAAGADKGNPVVKRAMEVEAEIAALRSQIGAG